MSREPWFSALPPGVRRAIESADFAVTLKAGDMDGLSAVNLARDAKIISTTLRGLLEELMRCGALAISERADGCVSKTKALKIREVAYRACWPNDDASRAANSHPQSQGKP